MNRSRHHSHTRSLLATVAAAISALLIGAGLTAPSAQAGYVVTLEQVADPLQMLGYDVVATGSGTLDLSALTKIGLFSNYPPPQIYPSLGAIVTGPVSAPDTDVYAIPMSLPVFGSGSDSFAASGSGDTVGITSICGPLNTAPCLVVPWTMCPAIPCRTSRPMSTRPL